MTQRETGTLIFSLGSFLALVVSLAYVVRARDPKRSVSEIILSGPLLFVSPERYFRPGRRSAPWRGLLIWLVPTIMLFWAVVQR